MQGSRVDKFCWWLVYFEKNKFLKLPYVPDLVALGQPTLPDWASSVFGSR